MVLNRWTWIWISLFLCVQDGFAQVWQKCKTEGEPFALDSDILAFHSRTDDLYIPVVFHIVMPNDAEQPSVVQIQSQLDALNDNFQAYQSIQRVPSQFRNRVVLPNIHFCLAARDPQGNLSEGVTRTITNIPNIGQHVFSDGRQSVHYDVLGGKDAWNPEKYLNIWVAEISSFAARASFPEMGNPEEDGIVIDPSFLGRFGPSNTRFSEGRTLVHEIGHYLNLQHPWVEPGCDTDDGIEDTPIQDGPYFGCGSPVTSRSCGNIDMIQNFMQFGDDPCLLFFTRDQVSMMHSILMTVRSDLILNGSEICGIDEGSSESEVRVFYQADQKKLQIVGLSLDEKYNISFLSISGQIAYAFPVQERFTAEILTDRFPAGIYIVKIRGLSGVHTKKVFVH
ncbi:MAG: T9SS type A sorting domain-containing protein [Bacteroidetes bacterium]|jgi:hypothetical protein|nr:T9SS type A sorting domain-containing protein [Bacteroidota bacterium]